MTSATKGAASSDSLRSAKRRLSFESNSFDMSITVGFE
jgi:hypothetical protein